MGCGNALRLVREIPGETREILRMIRAGRLEDWNSSTTDSNRLIGAMERVSNRLAFAVVLASLVIGSALIMLSGMPPEVGRGSLSSGWSVF